MKKILFSIMSLAAIAACNKNIDTVPSHQQDAEDGLITFGVSELIATRAVSESTGETVQAAGFKVAGMTSDGITYFNELATFVGGSYATAKKYYYPSGKTMDFYAVHPTDEEIRLEGSAASVEYAHSKYKDLIVAKRNAVAPQIGDVALTFDHILSQLIFTAKGSDASVSYKLNSIVVSAPDGGVYTFADGLWNRGDLADEDYWKTTIDVSSAEPTVIDESMTFLPGAIKVTVDWDTYVDGEHIAHYVKSTPAVTSDDAICLEQGKKNTINLTLPNASAQGISFSVTVNPWGAASQDVTLN